MKDWTNSESYSLFHSSFIHVWIFLSFSKKFKNCNHQTTLDVECYNKILSNINQSRKSCTTLCAHCSVIVQIQKSSNKNWNKIPAAKNNISKINLPRTFCEDSDSWYTSSPPSLPVLQVEKEINMLQLRSNNITISTIINKIITVQQI